MSFSSLGLSTCMLRAIKAMAYETPTAIQRAAIPVILQGRDVLACAQTGSGKTAAFMLPLLEQLGNAPRTHPRYVSVLVLVPTRELSSQIAAFIHSLIQHLPHELQALKTTSVFGGVSINPQMMALRGGTNIVIATPGRLLDLIAHNALSLGSVKTLVLDEADRLFDLGFADELGRILALLPAQRQHLFFSATFPPAVQALANTLLRDPVRIELVIESHNQPPVVQRAIAVDAAKRTQLLRHLIETNNWTRVLVFVATKHAAEMVAHKLRKVRINAEPFHGALSQGKRTQVLSDFKASRLKVVVATDVAARGIDIAQLPVVVNYDLPRSATDHLHRIGRTARAGEKGMAVSLVSAGTQAHWHMLGKHQKLHTPLEVIDGFVPVEVALEVTASTGGVKGKRPSKKDKLRALAGNVPMASGGQGHVDH